MNYKEESEANAFALELLMPRDMILKYVDKYKISYRSNEALISKLCNKFDVSEIAMKSRLLNLGILTTI